MYLMLLYKFTYSDGKVRYFNFSSHEAAMWQARMEGDHLLKFEEV